MSDTQPHHATDPKFAWRHLAQQGLPKRSAVERVADFLEIHGPYDEATAREQASRCIQCAEPTCVSGCPLSSPIPEWMALTAEGRFLEAASLLHTEMPMPEICARVCPSEVGCEGTCILSGQAEPVSIGAIERFLGEYAFAHQAVNDQPAALNGWRVAVVGSGPAGLTCADELAQRGYTVTIFDAELVPGGLLINGIPAFKLEKSVVQRRVHLLQKRGVVFRLGVAIGEDITLGELRTGYDAVFRGFDAWKARLLDLPGSDLAGVVQALPFILHKTTSLTNHLPAIDVSGKRVVVLGGGDTAMDCLRTAIRCGAHETVAVYRRDEASLPCGRHEYENAVEEGVQFVFQAAPVEFLGNDEGRVTGLRLIRTQLENPDSTGRKGFIPQPGTEFEMAADWVFLALGFDPEPFRHWDEFSTLGRNPSGGIVVDAHQMTPIPGVFAGGDIVRGTSLVVHTVRDARQAAVGIDDYLKARPRG